VKVLNEGGTLSQDDKTITVTDADSVTIILATGTNYRLGPRIFLREPADKLNHDLYPHEEVSAAIRRATEKGYAALKADHLADYQNLFGRVAVNLDSRPSDLPTSALLANYKRGTRDTWLEELMFQYGRYLLIASSREKSLPANLQGAWSQYEVTPWSGGYWHNINVQMNYWGAMSANLAETFEAYTGFFKAYLPMAREYARAYVAEHNPDLATDGRDVGWIMGNSGNAYHLAPPVVYHSGPGVAGMTAKLFTEYYLFTGNREFLEDVAYPALLGLSRFFATTLVAHDDVLLVEPSASPEQRISAGQLESMPGKRLPSGHYVTKGTTFDQAFVWETFNDTLILAKALGKQDPFLDQIAGQMTRLDPILVGASGQIKEYREENKYSDIGDRRHRHISHLCPLYPGTLINNAHPEWLAAASRTLDLRGNNTNNWAIVHRMLCRARLMQGDKAHSLYARLIARSTNPNLWTFIPPFQIDANLGLVAGVTEMLLQSHEGSIVPLPALPKAWQTGMFEGLVARGNFVVDVAWADGHATRMAITSRNGGDCRISHKGVEKARVTDASGADVAVKVEKEGTIRFATTKGGRYTLAFGQ